MHSYVANPVRRRLYLNQGGEENAKIFRESDFTLEFRLPDCCVKKYEWEPTVTATTTTVTITYSLKGGDAKADELRSFLAEQMAAGATSASKATVSTMWLVAESTNYRFEDDLQLRLFSTLK